MPRCRQIVRGRRRVVVYIPRVDHGVEVVLVPEAGGVEVAAGRRGQCPPHALDPRSPTLRHPRRVEEVHDVAEQHVDLGLGVAAGARKLPAPIRRDDRQAVQAKGLVPAAQVDLDEGTLPANQHEVRRDGGLGLTFTKKRLRPSAWLYGIKGQLPPGCLCDIQTFFFF